MKGNVQDSRLLATQRAYARVLVQFLVWLPCVASAHIVWTGDFETADLSQWSGRAQLVHPDRLQIVSDPVRQGKHALKVTVKQGDNPIGASGNRNELVEDILEPEGAEFFYSWSTRFDSAYPSVQLWQVFTQWHQEDGSGSPPIEFDVFGEELRLYHGPADDVVLWRIPLVRDVWHDFVFHVKWSKNPTVGFVELYYNGKLVLPKTMLATGANVYLKQGLYRNENISANGVVFHDGMVKATSLEDVLPSAAVYPPPTIVNPPNRISVTGASGYTAPATPEVSSSAASSAPVTGGCNASSGTALGFDILPLLFAWAFRRKLS